jgi:hypothetical protein
MALSNTIVGTTPTDIVSGTNTQAYAVVGLYFCNFTDSGEHLSIFCVKSGEAVSNENAIIKNLAITGHTTLHFPNEKFILGYGEKIAGSGRYGDRVTASTSYIEI